jgi:hypothetical protein
MSSRGWIGGAMLATFPLAYGISRPGEENLKLIDAPGWEITSASCATCHSLDYIPMNAPVMDRARWEKTFAKMVDKFGAPISKENGQLILDYLEGNYSGAKP